MPDGTPEQQAQEETSWWLEQDRPVPSASDPFGTFAQIGASVQNLVAAAGAGQFAVAPDTGKAVIDQLATVQDEVALMRRQVRDAAVDPRFGGGYAEQVSRFVQQVAAGAAGSAEEVLTEYLDELEQLKAAVARSIGNYEASDAGSAHGITSAGGQS